MSSSSSSAYSLNSPTATTYPFPPASSSSSLSSSSSPYSSFSSPASSSSPRKWSSRASAPPPPRRRMTSTTALAPPLPPHHASSIQVNPTVLSSPDPSNAVRTARRSVQFSKQSGANVNWARPLAQYHEQAPAVPPLPPSSFTMRPSAPAPVAMISTPTFGESRRASGSVSVSSSSGEDDLPVTPRLPPGAGAPDMRTWAVASDLKGLGMSNVPVLSTTPVPPQPELVARGSEDSLSSEAGSLGGSSVNTAASSSPTTPTTPTRLLFVSESLDALSKPNTLDELSRLRAAVKQLDLESQRLRRLKGKDPMSIKNLPRKAVPIITDVELRAKPKPRRPAVRHSLLTPSPRDGGYSFVVEPQLPVLDATDLPRDHPFSPAANSNANTGFTQATTLAEARAIAAAKAAKANAAMNAFDNLVISPPQPAAARRHAFYSQGKAAQSVIEFSPRKEASSGSNSGWTPPPFLRSRHASGAIPTLGDVSNTKSHHSAYSTSQPPQPRAAPTPASPAVPGPPVMFSAPVIPAAASIPMPPVPPQTAAIHHMPERKASHSFLKHKKLSRFFGKASE